MDWEWLGPVLLRGVCVGLIMVGLDIRGARAWAMGFGLLIAFDILKGA
jgi:hypothetical protein